MLQPFEFAILTVAEARLLAEFIEKQTSTKATCPNYDKMQKLGVLEIHSKLREFIHNAQHYEGTLKYLDTSEFLTADNGHYY